MVDVNEGYSPSGERDMRVWKAYWDDVSLGSMQSWHPSKNDARSAFATKKRDGDHSGADSGGYELIEIPTDKAGLINWLNRNFNTDNG